ARVEAVRGAPLDAVDGFAANAAIVDDVGQLGVLPADCEVDSCARSLCSLVGRKWTHRRSTSSGSIGTPSSRHLGAEELALVRLQRVSPLRYVQSWQIPKRRCAPLVAKVVSTWCRAWCIAVRSFASSKSTARTRTSNGSRASAFFPLLVSRRLTLRLSAFDRRRTKYPPASSALTACEAVPRVVA